MRQFSSVAQPYPNLRGQMDCSTPGFPVHQQHLKLAQIHVHWVGNAIQPSHPLLCSSPPAFSLSKNPGLFQSQFFTSGGQSWSFSISPSNEYSGLSTLGLTDWSSCRPRDTQDFFSNTTVQKHQFFSAQLSLFGCPNFTSIHDYWKKNHSFD